jgi:hypothetical protein
MQSTTFILYFTVNAFLGLLAAVPFWQGWHKVVLEKDMYLVPGICFVFLVSLFVMTKYVLNLSNEIINVKKDPIIYQQKYNIMNATCSRLISTLTLLGLGGTVIGMIIAFDSVDTEALKDVGSLGTNIGTLMQGVSIALYTTLAGVATYLWASFNALYVYRITQKVIALKRVTT